MDVSQSRSDALIDVIPQGTVNVALPEETSYAGLLPTVDVSGSVMDAIPKPAEKHPPAIGEPSGVVLFKYKSEAAK